MHLRHCELKKASLWQEGYLAECKAMSMIMSDPWNLWPSCENYDISDNWEQQSQHSQWPFNKECRGQHLQFQQYLLVINQATFSQKHIVVKILNFDKQTIKYSLHRNHLLKANRLGADQERRLPAYHQCNREDILNNNNNNNNNNNDNNDNNNDNNNNNNRQLKKWGSLSYQCNRGNRVWCQYFLIFL